MKMESLPQGQRDSPPLAQVQRLDGPRQLPSVAHDVEVQKERPIGQLGANAERAAKPVARRDVRPSPTGVQGVEIDALAAARQLRLATEQQFEERLFAGRRLASDVEKCHLGM